MAEGVKKTFRKRYRDNLIRAMELKLGIEDAEKDGRAIVDSLRAQGLAPTLEQNDAYREAEAELLRRARRIPGRRRGVAGVRAQKGRCRDGSRQPIRRWRRSSTTSTP